jgi:homoprotocatechuate degradation regulator HpaR
MLSKVGLTEQQWRVLRVLEECGVLDPTEISERACLLLPSLTRILHTLEGKALIYREPHPHDGRKQQITLTNAGRMVVEANMAEAMLLCQQLKAGLGEARLELLLDLLNDLQEASLEEPRAKETAQTS